MRIRGAVAAVVLAGVALAGCSGGAAPGGPGPGTDPVLDTGVEPVPLAHAGPSYAALDGQRLLVRDGDDVRRVRGRAHGWLPDGRLLVARGLRTLLVDPARGTVASIGHLGDSGRAVTQVNRLTGRGDRVRLLSYDLRLAPLGTHLLPPTDDPDAAEVPDLERGYFGAVPTIDGVTFVKWHDSAEDHEGGAHGVLRIEGDELTNVQVGANVVGHYLSADGSGLLGLRQVDGEPCGGCVVAQDVVEIDPATGEVAAEYGVPDEYDEQWRVAAMDKVGDRVAVRYYDAVGTRRGMRYEQRGTWVYDGDWSMVEGSDRELSWWQGAGRVVARPAPAETRRGDGWDLFWVAGGTETPLPGELAVFPQGVPSGGAVAGQLLPPPGAQPAERSA